MEEDGREESDEGKANDEDATLSLPLMSCQSYSKLV